MDCKHRFSGLCDLKPTETMLSFGPLSPVFFLILFAGCMIRVEIPFERVREAQAVALTASASNCSRGGSGSTLQLQGHLSSPAAAAPKYRRAFLARIAAANAVVAPQRQQHRWANRAIATAAHHWCSSRPVGAASRRRRRNRLHKEKFANQFSIGEYESVGPGGAAGMPVAERTLRLRLTLHCRCQSTLAELFTPHYSLQHSGALHTSQRATHSCTPQKCWAKGYNVAGDNGNYVERGSALEASMSGWMLCTIQHL